MKPLEYLRQLPLPTSAASVFRWHRRPGAFQRLTPPWERVTLDGPAAPLVPGARQEMVLQLGPLRLRWRAEITEVEEDRFFRDIQLSGPFASWEHTHSMLSGSGPEDSVLEDRVHYRLPLGPLGAVFGGGFARRKLERLFDYRHRITMNDLARHATAPTQPLDILVTGSSGMVGSALTALLSTGGHRVRRLVRRAPEGPDEFAWDPDLGQLDAAALEGVDAVVHLAGENIAGRRWTRVQKDRIRRSRVEGTRLLVDAVHAAEDGPKVFVCASAIGIYGDRGDEELDETSTEGAGYLAGVCQAWEKETRKLAGVRAVQLRFGVVLSPAGGALKKMLLPFQLGAGGKLGSGRQQMSWVALDDAVGAIHHALVTGELRGPANVVAPNAVTNAVYTKTLGRVLFRPTIAPMPAFAARLAFGELADELLLASQRVTPRKLQETGYVFAYPELEAALRHQLGRGGEPGATSTRSAVPAA